jgi:hypothetical protein
MHRLSECVARSAAHSFLRSAIFLRLGTRRQGTLDVTRSIITALLASVLVFGLAACGGGGASSATSVTTATTGQQLLDLKNALDSGAITQGEYERQRRKILNQ